jgi:FkbM family methyltransferase
MFQHQGIWLPDGEKHFPEWMTNHGELVDGKGTYQIKKCRAALRYVRNWRTAVDVGAHVGLWSMQLARRFQLVQAFEPVRAFRDCFRHNLAGVLNAHLMPYALGSRPGWVSMRIDPADSGGTHVDPRGTGDVQLHTIDGLSLEAVDFIKIDCEGYEHHVVEGARETLMRCKPCVIVEQKPHKLGPNFGIKGTPALALLLAMGAKHRAEISGDHILSWDA